MVDKQYYNVPKKKAINVMVLFAFSFSVTCYLLQLCFLKSRARGSGRKSRLVFNPSLNILVYISFQINVASEK